MPTHYWPWPDLQLLGCLHGEASEVLDPPVYPGHIAQRVIRGRQPATGGGQWRRKYMNTYNLVNVLRCGYNACTRTCTCMCTTIRYIHVVHATLSPDVLHITLCVCVCTAVNPVGWTAYHNYIMITSC